MHASDMFVFVFFFQAEDGIRDKLVTGVQTCALPIYQPGGTVNLEIKRKRGDVVWKQRAAVSPEHWVDAANGFVPAPLKRSEERRVGKECRSRWSRYH